MIQRQKYIILDIKYKNMNIKDLSNKYCVTERTIRNDINSINEELDKFEAIIIKNTNNEYVLDINNNDKFEIFEKKELLNFGFDYNEPQNRIYYMALRFLFSDEYIKLDDLMDEMYVSRSSIQNDMKEVRKILSNLNIDIETKPNYGIKVEAEEMVIRNAISSIINEMNLYVYSFFNNEIDTFFSKQNLNKIYYIIIDNVNNYNKKLSDIELNNLIVHIAIAMKRIENDQIIKYKIESDFSKEQEFIIANNIVKDLEKEFNVVFPNEEIYYIAMHLMGSKLIRYKGNDVNKIICDEDFQIIKLTENIVKGIDNQFDSNLIGDDELLRSIILHLKPAIYRYRNNMNIRNPLLPSIKKNYPYAFGAATIAGNIIFRETGILFSDEELGYIAIHLGAAFERNKINKKNIKTLIVCTTGLGSSKLLKYKLENKFPNQIDIIGTTELYNIKNYSEKDIDLIISTVPLFEEIDIPCIYLSDILGESDFKEIENFIEKFDNLNKKEYLDIDDIYVGLDFNNQNEIIEFLSKELVKKGKAPVNLYESILERERIASTSFGNYVAIPHPIKLLTEETFITVATNKKPIIWGNKPVKLIILLNIEKNTSEVYGNIFDFLLEIIDDKENVEKIIECETKEEIYKLFNI